GRQLLERRIRVLGAHPRERRLPGPGRPVEEHRMRLAGLDRGPQRRRRAEQVRLADELLQRARAHARGERQVRGGGRRAARRGFLLRRVEQASHAYSLTMGLAEELQDETAEVLAALIRFRTVNPPGHERVCQEWLAGYLSDAGLACDLYAAEPERPSLIARL